MSAEDTAYESDVSVRRMSRKLVVAGLFVVLTLVLLYFVLPHIAGLEDTYDRMRDGDVVWLAVAAAFELGSFFGYMILFRSVFGEHVPQIGWRESYLITMAGVAATRMLAAAGAGGIALTAWALRRAGMERRQVGSTMTTFLVLLYVVFMGSVLIAGILLRVGIFAGDDPVALTILPAALAGVVIMVCASAVLIPRDLEERFADRPGWWPQSVLMRVGAVGVIVADGVAGAIRQLRRAQPGIVGALLWWGLDILTLWACFHAFGHSPPGAVIVLSYFVGMVANVLPIPGGVGGTEGGMVACFAGFGVDAGLALVAVLAYSAFAYWLPTIPGFLAYLRLTRVVKTWSPSEN
ncbi:MAG: putative heme transporter [Solirubrobacteraceae bacterium]|jgi:uncharacterized membrane protein YbhN (UPF0104 family)|nr:putative heme transporter [Solirubrobacteraceae bacterium]